MKRKHPTRSKHWKTCPVCGGYGYRMRDKFDPPGKATINCADCYGTGKVPDELKKNPAIMQAPELPQSKHATRKPKPQAPALPKKNPALRYFLKVQKGSGPVMTFNGKSFTNNAVDSPHPFVRGITAKAKGKMLIREFSILKDYKMWVESKFTTDKAERGPSRRKHIAMRGGSKAPKVNPSPRTNAELDAAAKKLEDFSGHPVQHLESAYSRSSQKTGLIVGELDLIGYRARRDGKTERYGHTFKKNSRPLLAVTSDGKQLHIVGGQYEFTEAGIEDR